MTKTPHAVSPPLFMLGRMFVTPGAFRLLDEFNIAPLSLLRRHWSGDWSEMDDHDMHQNYFAIRAELRVLSSYRLSDDYTIWIITEADRSSTTILLPEEY
jgi:hypothetical protein